MDGDKVDGVVDGSKGNGEIIEVIRLEHDIYSLLLFSMFQTTDMDSNDDNNNNNIVNELERSNIWNTYDKWTKYGVGLSFALSFLLQCFGFIFLLVTKSNATTVDDIFLYNCNGYSGSIKKDYSAANTNGEYDIIYYNTSVYDIRNQHCSTLEDQFVGRQNVNDDILLYIAKFIAVFMSGIYAMEDYAAIAKISYFAIYSLRNRNKYPNITISLLWTAFAILEIFGIFALWIRILSYIYHSDNVMYVCMSL